jgi:hypothetical protein
MMRKLRSWHDEVTASPELLKIESNCDQILADVTIGTSGKEFSETKFQVGKTSSGEPTILFLENPWFPLPIRFDPEWRIDCL